LEEEKAAKYRARFGFWPLLAAKIEFSYGDGQTVNLLALRLQWFESTPTQASPRAKITWIREGSAPCRDPFETATRNPASGRADYVLVPAQGGFAPPLVEHPAKELFPFAEIRFTNRKCRYIVLTKGMIMTLA
jgi:hypothetical protein